MRLAASLLCVSILVAPILAQRADPATALLAANVADGPLAAMESAHDPRPAAPLGAIAVPEPSTLLLVGAGLVGFALTSRYRRRHGK